MAGRPEKYTLDFCFAEIKEILSVLNKDDKWTFITWHDLIKNKPYSRQRISEWRTKFKKDEQFTDTIKKIEDELENRILKLGLKNKANPTLVIFTLKNNYGWKDKSETELSGIPPAVNINVTSKESAEKLKEFLNGKSD
jgi:hypothetical protein